MNINFIQSFTSARSVVCLILVGLGLIRPPVSAAVIYSDDFESYTTGALYGQGNWRVANTPPTNNSAVIESSFVKSGTTALEMVYDSNSTTANWATHSLTTPLDTKTMTVSLWLGADTVGRRSASIILNTGTNPWDAPLLGVRTYANASTNWSEDFFYMNSDGSWTDTGVAMTGGTWWNLQISVDLVTRTYGFSVQEQNGSLQTLASGIALSSSVTNLPTWLQLTRLYGGASDEVYVDNINVSAVPEPSATALIAFFLSSTVVLRHCQAARCRKMLG